MEKIDQQGHRRHQDEEDSRRPHRPVDGGGQPQLRPVQECLTRRQRGRIGQADPQGGVRSNLIANLGGNLALGLALPGQSDPLQELLRANHQNAEPARTPIANRPMLNQPMPSK